MINKFLDNFAQKIIKELQKSVIVNTTKQTKKLDKILNNFEDIYNDIEKRIEKEVTFMDLYRIEIQKRREFVERLEQYINKSDLPEDKKGVWVNILYNYANHYWKPGEYTEIPKKGKIEYE